MLRYGALEDYILSPKSTEETGRLKFMNLSLIKLINIRIII